MIQIISNNITFTNGIVHQCVENATPSKLRAINDGIISKSKRTQWFMFFFEEKI
jgi:hypothetical protein